VKKSFNSQSPNDLARAVQLLLTSFENIKVFAFNGEMGAGKTTFIKEICASLGVRDQVSSPTYSLINEYLLPDGSPAYHFDFYRIQTPEELEQIGAHEFIDSGSYCFIEWAELAPEFLPPVYVQVTLRVDENSRTIDMEIVS
jgi:tRNA threonylcarbamoyladenosine biosynthesis protein TsaE